MIKVLKAGFGTSIQDQGRRGFASDGVPISGSMDSFSADISNHILNNSLDCAVLEMSFSGVELQFLATTVICISGGDFSPKIDQKKVGLNTRIVIQKNVILHFEAVNFGARCYLAVQGGFSTQTVLKSKSFYQYITVNSVVKKHDFLPFLLDNVSVKKVYSSLKILRNHFDASIIECYEGPEFELLDKHQKKQLLNGFFTLSKDISRMGFRLEESIKNELPSILTSSVLPGTVQLTPSGKLIVLMRDCQVTGGYPRVLQLSKNAINRLAQKTTNQQVKLQLVGL